MHPGQEAVWHLNNAQLSVRDNATREQFPRTWLRWRDVRYLASLVHLTSGDYGALTATRLWLGGLG
jgi:hypothetical protein